MSAGQTASEKLYRLLPSADATLLRPEFLVLLETRSRAVLIEATRRVLGRVRLEIAEGRHTQESVLGFVGVIAEAVAREVGRILSSTLVPVLNATGVILHTNLGRAPLSDEAIQAIVAIASGYSNLEFDLATGSRGRRDRHAEPMLLRALSSILGGPVEKFGESWGVVVVNNCAAATFLALNSLAEGGEVLVSRGELVEIGGGFRIPEILLKAGVVLREVGTTNRTRVEDYANALSGNTRMILRVHQSNFRMEGFTEKPDFAELIELGKRTAIPVFEDQGTGLMLCLDDLHLREEPSLVDSFRKAPDLIAASGDKLLGGPQCGLLLGRSDLMETIRTNPLLRALRVDKLTYAALEATLLSYVAQQEDDIPIIRMLRIPAEALRERCKLMRAALAVDLLETSVVPVHSVIGGGAAPGLKLASFALSLRHSSHTASDFLAILRRQTPPVIARMQNDCVLLDLRTVPPEQDGMLVRLLRAAAAGGSE